MLPGRLNTKFRSENVSQLLDLFMASKLCLATSATSFTCEIEATRGKRWRFVSLNGTLDVRGLLQDWEAWLREADKLYDRFLGDVGDPPFFYHEVASVGLLASAAVMAGFVPPAEYAAIKRGRNDKRTRVDGRADL
jgi:hypothetical protein